MAKQRLPEEPTKAFTVVRPRSDSDKPKKLSRRLDDTFDEIVQGSGLGWSTAQALGLIALVGVAVAGAVYLWREDLWLVAVGLVFGMVVPLISFMLFRFYRRRKMQNQLPDTLFLLARAVRAGLSMEQALENVAYHGHEPLAGEFRRTVEQIKLGLTVPAALQVVAQRLKLADFDAFVAAVALHRNLGGNLKSLLDRVATTTRDRNLFRGFFRAATALPRATAFCLAIGAPAIFIGYSFFQPDFAQRFWDSFNGIRIFAIAVMLEVIGIVWITYLLRVRY